MNGIDIIDEHIIIRETIGYDKLNEIDVIDIPEVLNFLKIVHNYMKMNEIKNKKG